MKAYLKTIIADINRCTKKELVLVVLSGIIGILWPLGGLLIFLFSTRSKYSLCGKIGFAGAVAALIAYSAKMIIYSII